REGIAVLRDRDQSAVFMLQQDAVRADEKMWVAKVERGGVRLEHVWSLDQLVRKIRHVNVRAATRDDELRHALARRRGRRSPHPLLVPEAVPQPRADQRRQRNPHWGPGTSATRERCASEPQGVEQGDEGAWPIQETPPGSAVH